MRGLQTTAATMIIEASNGVDLHTFLSIIVEVFCCKAR